MSKKKKMSYKDIDPYVPEERVTTKWEGEKRAVKEVMDTEFAVLDFQTYKSSFGEGDFVSIQAVDKDNKKFWFNTGSEVVKNQLERDIGKDNLPKKVKLTSPKGKRYYSLEQPDL